MFLGQFQHSLDEKGRLMVPSRYRELLAAGAFITQGFDKCLMVLTDVHFNEVYERINAMNMADPNARLLRRLILSNAYSVDIDRVGRILVPQNLRQAINLGNEAIVAGQGEYFEVWSPADWRQQMEQVQDVEMNSQRFATLDLSRGYGV
jgi:MraZ protein